MKAHARGGAPPPRPSPDPRPPSPDTKPPPTRISGGAAAGKRPAVKKGFLDSGGGGGTLYGEEGSREGGAVGSKGGRSSKVDREFDRLVALADPEMRDADGEVRRNTSSCPYSSMLCGGIRCVPPPSARVCAFGDG